MKGKKIKYPKILTLLITIIIAFLIFYEGMSYDSFHNFLISTGNIGIFLAGFFYAYGFTAAPATAVLLVLAKGQNLIFAVLIAGLGALISDFLIFTFIRHSFIDEINDLKKEKFMKKISDNIKKIVGNYQKYVFPALAGFLIASPLPTEIGVTMLASIKTISPKKFMAIAYLLHSLGILTILSIGNLI